MGIELYEYQKEAIDKLKTGSILCGGVGSGKSRTAIYYYFVKVCKGRIKTNGVGAFQKMQKPKDLYIITTAKKRDTLDWQRECAPFCLSPGNSMVVDSWNNIAKYAFKKNSFFIFDEQRLVGAGKWVKSFLKIAKFNNWIVLSATPGDTWSDYIPIFIANGFYKTRSEFQRRHIVYSYFAKFPMIDRYIETERLLRLRDSITIIMNYKRHTIHHNIIIPVKYNKDQYDLVMKRRWNIYKNKPIKTISELCYLLRKVVNSDLSRTIAIEKISIEKKRLIIFYNFDYELEILRQLAYELMLPVREWNGHKHEEILQGGRWFYLVQYSAAEGWECVDTDTIIFYSQNYSYKIVTQAAGRIDRLNTPYKDLYYYHLCSESKIDLAIAIALKQKKIFNVREFTSRKKHML